MKLLYKNFLNNSVLILLLRIILGVVFFAHGSQKVLGWFDGYGLEKTIAAFQQNLGIPSYLAIIASFTEFLGGIALVLGLFTRPAALGIIITMMVAMSVHFSAGFLLPAGFEYVLTLLVISVIVFLNGPGCISLDKIILDKLEPLKNKEN
ncbi:MAG: DoxX family protein [bacterium]